ncbi:hypothetical protein [Trichloromonas acetexigens]|uniref:Penicillin-binding protein activator LpoB n=1 Tax=Trichloromonas acetexigens TaxID=38815 RepID=A0A550JHL5_9BACT|nr:hypothetical protein [Desulfuromonas acetexigens]TRO82696.1 hypothetical protein FL622_05795 [Desulfuromonas acetexigens]
MTRLFALAVLLLCLPLTGCVELMNAGGAANARADLMTYQPVNYVNAGRVGPKVIVLPGVIKSQNATFRQQINENNIADFAELELGNANFQVLERADLGPMLNEITLAVNMGDPNALKTFRRGKFQSTNWFITFDILKAEQVSKAGSGFDGATVGNIVGALVGGTSGYVSEVASSSVQMGDTAGVWLVGMRYKIVDAATTQQVATGYFEEKMEVGKKGMSILGVSGDQGQGITLDNITQRLVQKCVQQIDQRK